MMIDRKAIRQAIATTSLDSNDVWADNLGIALCEYFHDHDNEGDDDEWPPPWVIERTEAALDAITDSVVQVLEKGSPA